MLMSASYSAPNILAATLMLSTMLSANNGNFHHALIHVDVIEGQALLVLLEQRHRLVHAAAAHGKADVLGPLYQWTGR